MAFTVLPATPADIPALISIYLASFTDPLSLALFPRTPATRAWWENDYAEGFKDPSVRMLKVVLSEGKEQGKTIAFAKWGIPESPLEGNLKEEVLPVWPETSDSALCDAFFGGLAEAKARIMKGRRYYYLEMLATLPEYQGRGAGSALLRWGSERADVERVPAYLDGSPIGASLYRQHGWEEKGDVIPAWGAPESRWDMRYLCMVREPREPVVG